MAKFARRGISLRWSAAAGVARAWSRVIRRVVASGLVAIGVLCALFSGVFRYVDQHFYTPETFLENTSGMSENADIREFLFQGFRSEIIQLADGDVVEEDVSGTVADRLDELEPVDLADPVTQERIERDQAIEEILLDVFDSELYESTFEQALRDTQREVVRSAELESAALLRDKGEIFFNMSRLYETLYPRLGADARTAEITSNVLPDDFGVFKVADRDTTISAVWTLMQKGPDWRGLMTLGAVLSFIGAVVIADRRPSTAIQFGGGMLGVAVVVVVLIMLIRFIVPLLAGGESASPVVATYATNVWPLIRTMIRLAIFGAVIAAVAGIARLIWPDNWVYSSVSDERGVRSIKRRRGEPEPVPQQQQQRPAAAAVPVGYPGYPQQPYGAYPPQQWGQPYPGQYPPGYVAPYPVGPYAQPAQAQLQPQHYTSPGQPTVPVMPVKVEEPAGQLVPPEAPPFDAGPGDLPADAARIVPRVVATADTTLDASVAAQASPGSTANATIVETSATTGEVSVVEAAPEPVNSGSVNSDSGASNSVNSDSDASNSVNSDSASTDSGAAEVAEDAVDEWATEKDW